MSDAIPFTADAPNLDFQPDALQVHPGEAPAVPENPEARRRLLMAVPQPDQPENLHVLPMPKVLGPPPDPARLAANYAAAYRQPGSGPTGPFDLGGPEMTAFQAAQSDLSPEAAGKALSAAQETGLSPQFAADNLDEVQRQQMQGAVAQALGRAPVLAGFAAQSHVHAAAVKDDLDNLSFLEWAITGRWELATKDGDPNTVQRGKVTPPFWWAALKDALAGQKFVAMTTKEAEFGLNLKEEEQLRQLEAEQGAAEKRSYGAHNFATKILVGAVKVLPSLGVLGGATVVGARVGGAPGAIAGGIVGNFAETYGPLYHRLTQIPGTDEVHPLLTDDEARAIAAVGAMATSVGAIVPGTVLLQKLPGVREVLQRIGGEALGSALTRPGVAQALTEFGAKFGKNYVAGIVMMMTQAAGTAATEEAAKATHGQPADLGRVGAAATSAALQAAQDLPLVAAYHPIVETIGAVARAHAEQAHLAGMVDTAKGSPLVGREPGVAAEVIGQAAGQSGASSEVYIPKEAWDAFYGDQAPRRAAELAQDQGRAYAEADATGGPVAIPIEQHLTAGLADAEKLLPDTALSPDGLTANEAKEAASNLGGAGEPIPGTAPEPTGTEAASYRDAALEMLNDKPIGEIRPEYYAAAGRKMGQRAIELAAEQDQTGLGDVQRRQGFNVVAEKAARDIRAEMDKLQVRISNVDRGALAAGDPAYLSAYDAMRGALEGQAAPGALTNALALMQQDARPIGFDEAAVADLLANPRPWSKLTPPEARNLADAVASIRKAAADRNEIALADRRASLRERVAEMRQHLVDHAGGRGMAELPPPSNAGKGPAGVAKEGAGKLLGEMHQPREILRRLGLSDAWDEFVKARNREQELARQVGDYMTEAYQENMPKALKKVRSDGVDGSGSPVVADDKWVRQDLWTLAGWFGSESGAQRLRNGLRITDEQIRTALEQLTSKEAEFIDSIHALNDEKLFPLVRDHEVATTGTSPPKIEARPYTVRLAAGTVHTFRGGYWPGVSAEGGGRAPETVADFWGTLRNGFPSTAKSFVNERSEQTAYRPNLNWSAYSGHINAVLHYLAYDDFVRNFGRLVNDREFRQVAADGLGVAGPQDVKELDKFVSVAARGKIEPAKDGAIEWGRIIGGGFRSRVAAGAFNLNLPVVAMQLSHIPAAKFFLQLPAKNVVEALGKSFVPSSWGEAHAQSEQLPYRWNGYGAHMREMLADIGPRERTGGRKILDAVNWLPYHLMDGFLSKTIWEAGRAKAADAGADAVAAAKAGDMAVATMMPPLNLAEQSSVARDQGVIGSMMLVRNFPNTLWNAGAMNAWEGRNAVLQSSPGWQRAKAVLGAGTSLAAAYLGGTWSAHILGRFMGGHGREEDETTEQYLLRSALAAPFYPIPLASDVAEIASRAIVSDKTLKQLAFEGHFDIQAAPLIAGLQGPIRAVGTAIDADQPDTDRIFAALKVAATMFRLPVYPLRPARFWVDYFAGDIEPRGPLDIAGGAFYGQRRHPSRNPFTAAQDVISGD